MNDITLAQYLEAKSITDAYEKQEQFKADEAFELMKTDLFEYFNNNIVGGRKIEKVKLQKTFLGKHNVEIIPQEPYFEECYFDEKSDAEIKTIGDKYGFHLHWTPWVYPK